MRPDITWLPLVYSEFLTGFSKRKQAKIAAKREKAIEREKNERKQEKREVRLLP